MGGGQRTELIVWCKRMSFQKEKIKKKKKEKQKIPKRKNKILKNKKTIRVNILFVIADICI